jgi:hypothetical protein
MQQTRYLKGNQQGKGKDEPAYLVIIIDGRQCHIEFNNLLPIFVNPTDN